jgi:energy-coupling factor transporter transmembrane protein EcfT
MAELTLFGYQPGHTVVHRLDVRFKLGCLVLLSLAGLKTGIAGIFLALVAIGGLLALIGVTFGALIRELRYLFVLLVALFIIRAVSTPGIPWLGVGFIQITQDGLVLGLLVSSRLLMVVVAGLVFVATTRPADITSAVGWLLRPLPKIAARRTAVMMGLVLRFIPLILIRARETSAAQQARCVQNRKNPVTRISLLALPLMRHTFERGDELALAMTARCFTTERSAPVLKSTRRDRVALLAVLGFCLLLLWI